MKRNYAADLLKSILLISVFICHISGMLISETTIQIVGAAAGIGMEIFFVLSGFLPQPNIQIESFLQRKII